MTTVYVIVGQAGIYSDRREWAARVFREEGDARAWVIRATSDGERARREFEAMEGAVEEEAGWCLDDDEPGRWPARFGALVAGMVDGGRPLGRVLYYRCEPLRYRIDECELEE